MPELPEIETIKNGILPLVKNSTVIKVIIRTPRLRWLITKNLAKKIARRKVKDVTRRGKYLIFHFDNGFLLLHLGMSGSLTIVNENVPVKKHDHVDICFANHYCLRFNDPRKFGCMLWSEEAPEKHNLLQNLGVEPLSQVFNSAYLFNRTCKSSRPIKLLLMDNKIVTGIGNIYASEVLFKAKIHPQTKAKSLSKTRCAKLVVAIKQILTTAIKARGTSFKDYRQADGRLGYFRQKLAVYGREGKSCKNCNTILKNLRIGQRSTVFCPRCQEK